MRRGVRALAAAAAACALTLGPPVAAARTAASPFDGASLSVLFAGVGASSVAAVDLALQGTNASGPPGVAARVTVGLPAGFGIVTTSAPGTSIGVVHASLSGGAGSSAATFADSSLVVDDPAVYAADPIAQACDPGPHAAVWRATFSALGQQIPLPIAVDAVGGTAGSAPTYTLTFCPFRGISPELPTGLAFLDITTLLPVTGPTTPGTYTWSALVTPAVQFAADPTQAFELRAIVPIPERLTLDATYEPRARTVVLSGRLTAGGAPWAGVDVDLLSLGADGAVAPVATVRTGADGSFELRRPIRRTTQFAATVEETVGGCAAPSTAPGGCLSQTVTPPSSAAATAIVPRQTDPKLVVDSRDQALARRSIVAALDLPTTWQNAGNSPAPCAAFAPDLRRLTMGGQAFSPVYASPDGNIAVRSTATVYSSREQAATAFSKVAVAAAAKCEAIDVTSDGSGAPHVRSLALPRLGDASRAFRAAVATASGVVDADILTVRVGRVVIEQDVYALGASELGLDLDLARKAVARARPG